MHNSARVYQQRYDDAFSAWGMRAKAPTLGEDIDTYRRDLAVMGKKLLPENHDLRAVQYRGLRSDAFEVFEPQLLKAVSEAARRNDSVPDGTMRQIVEINPDNGQKMHRFLGTRSFVEFVHHAPGLGPVVFKSPTRHAHIFGYQTRSFYPPRPKDRVAR
jgi:hypothetical protein